MRHDKITVKAREAIARAHDIATESRHAEVRPEHLLFALLAQEDGLLPRLLARIGADGGLLRRELERSFESLPRVQGTALDVGISRELKELWEQAAREASAFKDEYISTEHFVLAISRGKDRAGDAMRAAGVTHDALMKALSEVRGSH